MKIVVVSDNHYDLKVLKKIINDNYDADYFLHLGDSELYESELSPFVSVLGNVDFDGNLPLFRVIDIGKFKIYMCHGHLFDGNPVNVAKEAKINNCSLALFGHTHRYFKQYIDDILVVNPGSCSRGKDGCNSYAIITLDNDEIIINRIII